MTQTALKYMSDTFCLASLAKVESIGSDEDGTFLILDSSIHYMGGGGQRPSITYLSFQNKVFGKVARAKYIEGQLKHYVEAVPERLTAGDIISMQIDRHSRVEDASYHTAGHWIASIVTENILLPLTPTKGFHYPNGAYVEFQGDKECLPEDLLYMIEYAMRIDRQANLNVTTEIISHSEFEKRRNEFALPQGFKPFTDRPLRIVAIEDYRAVCCGGNHVTDLNSLHPVKLSKVKIKNGRIRISYEVDVPQMIYPS